MVSSRREDSAGNRVLGAREERGEINIYKGGPAPCSVRIRAEVKSNITGEY